MLSAPPATPAREPIFNLPGVVLACVLGLLLIHAIRSLLLAPETNLQLLLDFAVVPARWWALDPSRVEDIVRGAGAGLSTTEGAAREALARYVLADGEAKPWTALTYALLHGSWSHVLLNSVWLAAFGTPVARRCGAVRFFLIAAVCAVGGALAHAVVNADSVVPMIGASASVSGLMAAAATFVFPAAHRSQDFRISTTSGAHDAPRQSIGQLMRNRSAAVFLGVWFATNLLFGLVAQPLGIVDAAIAWEAHLGGFFAGLMLFPWLDRRPNP